VETTLPQFGRLVKAPAFLVMHRGYGAHVSALQEEEDSRSAAGSRRFVATALIRRTMTVPRLKTRLGTVAVKPAEDECQPFAW